MQMSMAMGVLEDDQERRGRWAHPIVSKHWGAIAKIAGDSSRLPIIVESKRGRPVRFDQHGCGTYGCVMPTGTPGVVFKVTSDPDEAGFVELWLRTRVTDVAPGTVRYYAIAELPDRHRQRPVYALWREEARQVGGAVWSEVFDRYLRLFQELAAAARKTARRTASFRQFADEVLAEADRAYHRVSISDLETRTGVETVLKAQRGVKRAAVAVAGCRMIAELMRDHDETSYVGSELLRWIDEGVVLCDVHRRNIGIVDRFGRDARAITDPGHALLLANVCDGRLRVPGLDEATRLGWRDRAALARLPNPRTARGNLSVPARPASDARHVFARLIYGGEGFLSASARLL